MYKNKLFISRNKLVLLKTQQLKNVSINRSCVVYNFCKNNSSNFLSRHNVDSNLKIATENLRTLQSENNRKMAGNRQRNFNQNNYIGGGFQDSQLRRSLSDEGNFIQNTRWPLYTKRTELENVANIYSIDPYTEYDLFKKERTHVSHFTHQQNENRSSTFDSISNESRLFSATSINYRQNVHILEASLAVVGQLHSTRINSKQTLDTVQITNQRHYSTFTYRNQNPNDKHIGASLPLKCDESPKSSKQQERMPTSSHKIEESPKNVLNSFFDVVVRHFNNKSLQLESSCRQSHKSNGKQSWSWTYYMKWPEIKELRAEADSKKKASHKAALAVIRWLRETGKMSPDGYPILIDKEEVKTLQRSSIPKINLGDTAIQHMKNIYHLYEDTFLSQLFASLNNKKNDRPEEWVDVEQVEATGKQVRLKFFGNEKYMAREKIELPISKYKDDFINLLNNNDVVIVKGEPGCGKSTRIPQYVLESWIREVEAKGKDCRIAVTQPRRIAATSLAQRVSSERDEELGEIVGFHIRFDKKFNRNTARVIYCTAGVLLKRLQADPTLSEFSHVILDEVHERDLNTDLLMNMLRDCLQNNWNLKLIVMSATIDTDIFTQYFNNARVMHIPGFSYPVKSHFLDDLNYNLSRTRDMCNNGSPYIVCEDVAKVIMNIHRKKGEGAILCFLPGWDEIQRISNLLPNTEDMAVLPLHAKLPDEIQRRVFSRPPPGVRKVILATDIAETSITIDDVVYVIDTGIHKENRFDNEKGVQCLDNHWISQSSMAQRKGRAGRVQPGESYHLYPKRKFEKFDQYSVPEILRTSLTKTVLDAKLYSNNKNALEFMSNLLSPPDRVAVERAVRELKDLELLDDNENLMPLGKMLADFPLEPKFAKALVNGAIFMCFTPVLDIITLYCDDTQLFGSVLEDKERIRTIKKEISQNSDHIAVMNLFEKFLQLKRSGMAQQFCEDFGLIFRKLGFKERLRNIHSNYMSDFNEIFRLSDDFSDNNELVKAALLLAVSTMVRHRNYDIVKRRYKKADIYLTNSNQKGKISSESVNYKRTSFPSDYFLYLNEVRSNTKNVTMIRESSNISPLTAILFSNKSIEIKEIINDNEVIVGLKNTNAEFICSKEDFQHIKKCRQSINEIRQYLISQVAERNKIDQPTLETWMEIVGNLDQILKKHSV